METKSSETTAIVSAAQGRIEKRRYVMDFGPNAALKDATLNSIEDWIANGCKYSGAILIKSSPEPAKTDNQVYVTALEIEVKAYTVNFGFGNDVTPLILGSPLARGEERLVLSDELRVAVSETVEKALSYTLGENGKDVVLSKLRLDYGFGFSEVTDFPGRFMELLTEVLQGGSKYVEERIIQELRSRYTYLGEDQTFKDAVLKLVAADSAIPR
jgi:hypothetical protein